MKHGSFSDEVLGGAKAATSEHKHCLVNYHGSNRENSCYLWPFRGRVVSGLQLLGVAVVLGFRSSCSVGQKNAKMGLSRPLFSL